MRDTVAYAFGAFRLDSARRTLTRGGEAIALTPTVFDTLLYLVEHPGRVVSKEELLDAVWPRRVVAESNISQTIFTLRRALGDEAREARMIVTAPGQGYRFTAPVRPEPGPASSLGEPDAAHAPSPLAQEPLPPVPTTISSRPRRLVLPLVLAGAVVMVALAALVAVHPWREAAARSLVVLADFQNLTGDPIYDRTLAKALEIDLVQSPFVTVLSERQAQDTLSLMARPRDEPLKSALAEEVCLRNSGQAVLEGSIAALGPRYLLTLKATDCTGNTTLAAEKAEVTSREGVITALDRLAARVRQRLGESARSVRRFDVPLARQKTASLEALKAYSEAAYLFNHGSRVESIPLFQHAIELDPNFAAAYDDLGTVYSNIHESKLAAAAIEKAYALRDTVSERERFHIIANYSEFVIRDVNETIRNLRLWSETYPRDGVPFANLANAENWLGHYPAAIDAGRRALVLRPNTESSYVVLARALMHADRLGEAAAICAQAVAKGLAGDDTHSLIQEIAFARGDLAGAAKELAWSRGKPAEIRLTAQAARHAYRLGQVRLGSAMFAHVAELSKEQGLTDFDGPPTARELYDLGLVEEARALLARVAPGTDTNDFRYDLAEFGEAARAEALLAQDLKASPSDTLLSAVSASEVKAALALRHGRPQEAIADLQPALAYEAKNYDIPYLRGVAYLAAADGARASVEFHKILDHPGLEPTSPLYSLARLGLARAQRLAGDTGASLREYQALLATWKDADPDVPTVRAARAEYAALGGVHA